MRTKSALAMTRAAVTAMATALVNMRTGTCQPAGSSRGVATASSWSRRAASAAPASAIQRVRCWTSTMAPATPTPPPRRAVTSMMGSAVMAASTLSATVSSNRARRRSGPAGGVREGPGAGGKGAGSAITWRAPSPDTRREGP